MKSTDQRVKDILEKMAVQKKRRKKIIGIISGSGVTAACVVLAIAISTISLKNVDKIEVVQPSAAKNSSSSDNSGNAHITSSSAKKDGTIIYYSYDKVTDSNGNTEYEQHIDHIDNISGNVNTPSINSSTASTANTSSIIETVIPSPSITAGHTIATSAPSTTAAESKPVTTTAKSTASDGTVFTVIKSQFFVEPATTQVGVTTTNSNKGGLPGDVNGDGRVDAKDVKLLYQYLSGLDVQINFDNSDLNNDGIIDHVDLLILQKNIDGSEGISTTTKVPEGPTSETFPPTAVASVPTTAASSVQYVEQTLCIVGEDSYKYYSEHQSNDEQYTVKFTKMVGISPSLLEAKLIEYDIGIPKTQNGELYLITTTPKLMQFYRDMMNDSVLRSQSFDLYISVV